MTIDKIKNMETKEVKNRAMELVGELKALAPEIKYTKKQVVFRSCIDLLRTIVSDLDEVRFAGSVTSYDGESEWDSEGITYIAIEKSGCEECLFKDVPYCEKPDCLPDCVLDFKEPVIFIEKPRS